MGSVLVESTQAEVKGTQDEVKGKVQGADMEVKQEESEVGSPGMVTEAEGDQEDRHVQQEKSKAKGDEEQVQEVWQGKQEDVEELSEYVDLCLVG